jgi:hypothetical protein
VVHCKKKTRVLVGFTFQLQRGRRSGFQRYGFVLETTKIYLIEALHRLQIEIQEENRKKKQKSENG